MKIKILLLALILSTVLISSFAQQACCGQNQVRVRGDGQTKVKPNIAIIYVSLSQDGNSATDALAKLNTQLDAIYNVLQINGVGKNDITASSISVYPRYDYSSGTGVIVGSTVYLSLTINIRGIDQNSQKIASVIDAVASVGATSVYGITYDTTDPNAGKSIARKNAWNDAWNKAKQYAQLSGRKLGKVLIIDESNQIYTPYYYGANGTSIAQRTELQQTTSSTPQIPPGQMTVVVWAIIVWQLI